MKRNLDDSLLGCLQISIKDNLDGQIGTFSLYGMASALNKLDAWYNKNQFVDGPIKYGKNDKNKTYFIMKIDSEYIYGYYDVNRFQWLFIYASEYSYEHFNGELE